MGSQNLLAVPVSGSITTPNGMAFSAAPKVASLLNSPTLMFPIGRQKSGVLPGPRVSPVRACGKAWAPPLGFGVTGHSAPPGPLVGDRGTRCADRRNAHLRWRKLSASGTMGAAGAAAGAALVGADAAFGAWAFCRSVASAP